MMGGRCNLQVHLQQDPGTGTSYKVAYLQAQDSHDIIRHNAVALPTLGTGLHEGKQVGVRLDAKLLFPFVELVNLICGRTKAGSQGYRKASWTQLQRHTAQCSLSLA